MADDDADALAHRLVIQLISAVVQRNRSARIVVARLCAVIAEMARCLDAEDQIEVASILNETADELVASASPPLRKNGHLYIVNGKGS